MTLPKWLDKNREQFKKSKKHENRLAKELDGQRLRRSGGMQWSKWVHTTEGADIKTKRFSIEHKRTEKKSMVVEHSWLLKIRASARASLRMPAVIITFEEKTEEPDDWVLIPKEVFQRLVRLLDGDD